VKFWLRDHDDSILNSLHSCQIFKSVLQDLFKVEAGHSTSDNEYTVFQVKLKVSCPASKVRMRR
jgi:hypothetical protein